MRELLHVSASRTRSTADLRPRTRCERPHVSEWARCARNHMVFLKDLTFTSSQCGRMLKVPALAGAQLASSEDASRLLSAMLLPCWNG